MMDKNVQLRLVKKKDTPPQRSFNTADAAKYLGISRSSLIRRTNAGRIICYNDEGRRSYRLEDLDAYIEKRHGWTIYHKEIPREGKPDKG